MRKFEKKRKEVLGLVFLYAKHSPDQPELFGGREPPKLHSLSVVRPTTVETRLHIPKTATRGNVGFEHSVQCYSIWPVGFSSSYALFESYRNGFLTVKTNFLSIFQLINR